MAGLDKNGVYEYLREKGVAFEITEHNALFHMGEDAGVEFPYPGCDAKNLFIRDKKKKQYFLITVKGDKRVDLKRFREEHGTRALTFASPEDLLSIMGLTPGSVTPFGLLNDEERKVDFYLDSDFFTGEGKIGVHPNDNTATIWLDATDIESIIKEHGNKVERWEV